MVMSLIESLTRIKNAVYGREVREAIHDGVFRANQVADGADAKADKTQIRQDAVEVFNNQVIQEMTDKDVISAPEIIQARGDKPNLKARLDETTDRLSQIAVNVMTFGAKVDRLTDDVNSIQDAIDFVHNQGGGDVLIPSGFTRITNTLELKENVRLFGNRDTTILYDNLTEPVVNLHKRTTLQSLRISTPKEHHDAAIEINSQYAASLTSQDKSFGLKINIRDVYCFTEHDPNGSGSIGLRLIGSDVGGGVYQVNVSNAYFHSFDTVISLETIGAGWVNGNVFRDVTATNFVTGVKVTKSALSQGIDYNLFDHLYFQAGPRTLNMIEDTNITNTYMNLEMWDLKTNPQARMGTASTIFSNVSGKGKSKLYMSNSLYNQYYYLVGSFVGGGTARFFSLSIKNGFSYDTELLMLGTKLVTRRQKGLLQIDKDSLKVFTKEIENGRFEVYLKSDAALDVSVYFENYEGFAPSMFTYYDNVDNLTEVTNERNHIFSQQDGIVESGANFNKYANGHMECWGTASYNPIALEQSDTQIGIYALTCPQIQFPVPFISNPNVQGTSMSNFRPISVKFSRTPTHCTPTVVSNTNSLEVAQTFSWFATGKWK